MKRLFIILLTFLSIFSFSQDKNYVREIIETIASPEYHGRGYYKHGDKKAAKFIRKEFKKNGIHAFNNNYFQEFAFSMNIIKGKTRMRINDVLLEPGRDYLIAAFSPTTNMVFEPFFLMNDSLSEGSKLSKKNKKLAEGKVIITDMYHKDLKRGNYFDTPAVIVKEDDKNLWWHVSNARSVEGSFVAEVKSGSIPGDKIESVRVKFRSDFVEDYQTQNVTGYLKGLVQPDTFIVFTAHYDHLGCMGKDACFPGANDNGSGTAMIMDLARHYASKDSLPYYSMVFMAFAGEEAGLVGSRFAAENPLFPLSQVKFLINLDMVGTGSDGITVVNGTLYEKAFNLLKEINQEKAYLKNVKIRGESCNSDHCPFYQKGVPSVFIYTMGKEYNEYHTVDDKPDDLPLTEYEDFFRLLTDFVQAIRNINLN